MNYTNWAPGQEGHHREGWLFGPDREIPPNALEDCAQIRLTDHGLWHDVACDVGGPLSYSYICQFGECVCLRSPTPSVSWGPLSYSYICQFGECVWLRSAISTSVSSVSGSVCFCPSSAIFTSVSSVSGSVCFCPSSAIFTYVSSVSGSVCFCPSSAIFTYVSSVSGFVCFCSSSAVFTSVSSDSGFVCFCPSSAIFTCQFGECGCSRSATLSVSWVSVSVCDQLFLHLSVR